MPGEDFQSWSVTAGNNSNSDTLINWAEGQPRASVNNSARSLMAAQAKHRNLNNGSITTGGSANAQTFTSGVGYLAPIPTGLRVMLKLGFTNTGAATLEMDSTGTAPIKTDIGTDFRGGELVAGSYAEFLYDGTNWIFLHPSFGGVAPQNGQLTWVSSTALKFSPWNGNQIKINGLLYSIPAAGIVGLANTSVFVNGVAAQNLAASTLYYVYAFTNSAVVTADFSTTTHATSAALGNEGVEIKTADETRTLIGMIYTNASSQFQDDATGRSVLSWFNRVGKNVQFSTIGGTTTSGSLIGGGGIFHMLNWANEAVYCDVRGQMTCNSPNAEIVAWSDGTTIIGAINLLYENPSTVATPISAGGWANPAEGHHVYQYAFSSFGGGGGGTVSLYNPYLTGMTRG